MRRLGGEGRSNSEEPRREKEKGRKTFDEIYRKKRVQRAAKEPHAPANGTRELPPKETRQRPSHLFMESHVEEMDSASPNNNMNSLPFQPFNVHVPRTWTQSLWCMSGLRGHPNVSLWIYPRGRIRWPERAEPRDTGAAQILPLSHTRPLSFSFPFFLLSFLPFFSSLTAVPSAATLSEI
jgi:hypothetical protein